jgi:hypothetical protein
MAAIRRMELVDVIAFVVIVAAAAGVRARRSAGRGSEGFL